MKKVIIRNARAEDVKTLVALLKELFALEEDFNFDEKLQAKGLFLFLDGCRKHRALFVADLDGKIVGMCSLQTMISTSEGGLAAVLEDLVVDKGHRGKGIGIDLLNAASSWSEKMGIGRVQLLADKNNKNALDFYLKQKWESTALVCLRKRIQT